MVQIMHSREIQNSNMPQSPVGRASRCGNLRIDYARRLRISAFVKVLLKETAETVGCTLRVSSSEFFLKPVVNMSEDGGIIDDRLRTLHIHQLERILFCQNGFDVYCTLPMVLNK